LVAAQIIAINCKVGVSFFSTLNATYLFFLLMVYMFRKKLQDLIAKMKVDLERLPSERKDFAFEYHNKQYWGALLISIALVFGGFSLFLSLTDTGAYFQFIHEDSIVEYASALSWAISACLLAVYFFFKRKDNHLIDERIYLACLVVFFVVCAGEEVSWGQRIAEFESPELIKAINIQQETNLHNIGSISVFSNLFFILTFAYFIVIPYLTNHFQRFRQIIGYLSFPVPEKISVYIYCIGLVFWVVIGIRFGTLGFHPFSFYTESYYTQMDDEIFEFFAAYSFFAFSIMLLNRKIIGTPKMLRSS